MISDDMRIKFGTSGARGLVVDFNYEVCAALIEAFIKTLKSSCSVDRVAIGMDLRPSSLGIANFCCRAMESLGLQVENLGVLPTPALALYSIESDIPSIMVTGSHIPFDRNGLKFYRPEGEITKQDEQKILETLKSCFETKVLAPDFSVLSGVLAESEMAAVEKYLKRYTSLGSPSSLAGWKIGIYEHSAAGRDYSGRIFQALGATVVPLGRSDQFVPIDTEAVSQKDSLQAKEWVKAHNLDALFTTDGDGDRPLLADETGRWWRGDVLGLICAKELDIDALAVPVSSNSAIERSGVFKEVVRTKIGSPYVLSALHDLRNKYEKVAGFEANGGFILETPASLDGKLIPPLPTRDALLPVIVALLSAVRKNISLSEFNNSLPARYTASDRLQEVPVEFSSCLIQRWASRPGELMSELNLCCEVVDVDLVDGLRLTLSNNDVIHLRPSGNAPELRCYSESHTEQGAAKIVYDVLAFLKSKLVATYN